MMRHKAIVLFNHFGCVFDNKKKMGSELKHVDFLKPFDTSIIFTISPNYDDCDGKIAYYTIIIHEKESNKVLMRFTINSGGGMNVHDDFFDSDNCFPQEEYINKLLGRFSLDREFNSPISVIEIDPIPAGDNPYRHDNWRQGLSISKHWEVMFATHSKDEIDYVRLINTKTGRRFDIDLYDAEKPLV